MNKPILFQKIKFVVIIALIASATSTFALYKYIQDQKGKSENTKIPLQNIVMAKTDLLTGKTLTESDLITHEWPEANNLVGSFSDLTELEGRVIKTDIYQGEPILESKLSPAGSQGGFSGIIPVGMRALAVSVNAYSGVSGFILPGTQVDVLVTVPSAMEKEESKTKIILEDIKVLAVDQTFQREGDEPVTVQTVTLLVTPDDSEKLALANTEGKLQLSLRNNADHLLTPTSGIRLKDLMLTPQSQVVRSTPTPSVQTTRRTVPRIEEVLIEIIRCNDLTVIKMVKENDA